MDDPISALDKKVVKSIFKDLFLDELKDKTRILVTHSIEFLNHFDKIVLLKKGRIAKVGTYEEVQGDFFIQKLKDIHKANQE
jgi:ABC-type transport system involved in cytochrome bd biosynthesis fused ATPase/permease subunit